MTGTGNLSTAIVNRILDRLPAASIGVLGDLFLDRYLDLDATLTEPSLETGLDAYQVAGVRSLPGAAGTIINNLVALGVGKVFVISIIGDDGEGYELTGALSQLKAVDARWVLKAENRRTPTYMKPMLMQPGQPARELNRLDIKNRIPTPPAAEDFVLQALSEVWPQIDALLVLDQVSEPDCGVITKSVRQRLAEIGETHPEKLILADSRQYIGEFRRVSAKPNQAECLQAAPEEDGAAKIPHEYAMALARRLQRPVYCTCGKDGMILADPQSCDPPLHVPAYPAHGRPIDVVGAGDSTSAAIACAICAGATLGEAAAFGNLVASITIQQIGTTGTATPTQVRARLSEVSG